MERINRIQKFNSWMKKINSNYYANHTRMRESYERLDISARENCKKENL